MELRALTALELGAAIRRGEVSIPAVTELALKWAEQAGDNAFITLTGEEAMGRARGLQSRLKEADSPLYGVPMALKDNLCTRGVPTTCASRMLEGWIPPYSAAVVEQLANAGTVSIGKTNLDEFAMGGSGETSRFGPARNPWDKSRTAGGSSSGSAAAVAGGSCWFALGSDTGGSVRQPAAHCGLTGVRPTYGTVSRYGLVAYASSLDQVGPLCRDGADCAAVLDVIQLPDRRDATTVKGRYGGLLAGLTDDVRGMRLGIPVHWFGEGLDAEVRAAVLSAAEVLKGRGAEVVELPLPMPDWAVAAYYAMACAEASSNLSRYDGVRFDLRAEGADGPEELSAAARARGFGAEVKRRILLGTYVLGHYEDCYRKALGARETIGRLFREAFTRCDALLAPVTPTVAPRLGESAKDRTKARLSDVYTVPAALAGLPALSMPCGFDGRGLPIGAQLIGPRFGEQTILNLAHAHQRDTGWHRQRAKGGGV